MSSRSEQHKGHRGVLWTITAFTLLSAALSVIFILRAGEISDDLVTQSRAAAIHAVSDNASLIENKLAGLTRASQIAADLTSGELIYAGIDQRLNNDLETGDGISITVAWLPDAVPDVVETAEDAVIYFKAGVSNNQDSRTLDGYYTRSLVDNLNHGDISVWYRKALEADRGVWISSPYKSPVSDTWWACGYSVPFTIDGKTAGVVAAELTLKQAAQILFLAEEEAFEDMPIEASYTMLVSENGTIFSHPDHTIVEEHGNITGLFSGLHQPLDIRNNLQKINQTGKNGSSPEIFELADVKDARTGQLLSVFFTPVKNTQWWSVLVLDPLAIDRSNGTPQRIKSGKFNVVVSLLAFMFGLTLLICRVDRGIHGRHLAAAIITTLICSAGIAWVLSHSFSNDAYINGSEAVLQNRAIPAKVAMRYELNSKSAAARVPTGIFVQSAEFSNANDVTITGFVWQTYDKSMPHWLQRTENDTEPGFIFPESEQTDVEFRYLHESGGSLTFGWYFTAVLRQEFDYRRYPFDLENVWIRMWHSEIGRDVILVPDLQSYSTLIPDKFPGRELQDFVLEGWNIIGTYFSYRENSYNTDFGITDYNGHKNFPELYFNITLTRSFLNAFIMNFITLTVAAFLLYAVLHTVRNRKEKQGLRGFNVSAVLGFCAALFFVVILAHTSLRESLAAPTLVYLEYYFFVMYFAFLGVSVNAILVASYQPHRLIMIGDNLVARRLFWPLLSIALLIATLVRFY